MSTINQIVEVLTELTGRKIEASETTRLREDLNLDSANLIELTVLIHSKLGVDIGRRAAEQKLTPETVGDLASLLVEA